MCWIYCAICLFVGVAIGLVVAGLLRSAAENRIDEIPL